MFIGSRWECPNKCGRHYKYNKDLNRHLQRECGVVPQYSCDKCKKLFKRNSDMKRHFLTCTKVPSDVLTIFYEN